MKQITEASTLNCPIESSGSTIVPQTANDELEILKQRIAELEAENLEVREILMHLEGRHQKLKQEFAELEESLQENQTTLLKAKDPNPVERVSETRVRQLARQALIDLSRWGRGWIIRFGSKRRWFKTLKDIWLILTAPSWILSEFFDPKANPIPRRKPHQNQASKTNGHRPLPSDNRPFVPRYKLTPSERDQLKYNPVVKRQSEALEGRSVDFWHQDHLKESEEAALAIAFGKIDNGVISISP